MGPETKTSARAASAAATRRARESSPSARLPCSLAALALRPRLPALVRCALYAVALLVLFAPRTARADGPMCDRVGASVNVAPEVPPARSGRLEELPCDTDKLLLLLDEVQQPRRALFHESDQHQVPAWLVASTFWWRAPLEGFADKYEPMYGPLQGHPRQVYRPPLAV